MVKDVLHDTAERMHKTLDALREDLKKVRTGRASPALVENLSVEYYGMPTPLQQLATINAPEPRLLAIKPFNRGDMGIIERAILKSDLGLNPSNDGQIMRLIIPMPTEERRRELARQVDKRVEEARVSVRNIRRDAIEDLREFEKEKLISEDDLRHGRDEIQRLTDRQIEQIDTIGRDKETEVMEV